MFRRRACSIEFDDKVVVTGGYDQEDKQTNRVSVYNVNGFVEYLPNMFTKRESHGCAHFIDNDDNIVWHQCFKPIFKCSSI